MKTFKTKIRIERCVIKTHVYLRDLFTILRAPQPIALVAGDVLVDDVRVSAMSSSFLPSHPGIIEFGLEFFSATSTFKLMGAAHENDNRLSFRLANGRRMALVWRDSTCRVWGNKGEDGEILFGFEQIDLNARLGYIGYAIPEDDSGFGAEGYNGA